MIFVIFLVHSYDYCQYTGNLCTAYNSHSIQSYKFCRNRKYFREVALLAAQVRRYRNADACSSGSSVVLDKHKIVCVKTWNECFLPLLQADQVTALLLSLYCYQHLHHNTKQLLLI